MFFRSASVVAFAMMAVAANGAECRLDHASYTEPVSGAVMQFHPKGADEATMTMGVFVLSLPNSDKVYAGDITWNAGNNARPDPVILDFPSVGNAYAIDNGKVGLIDDADMLAPPAILIVDFGRALHDYVPFIEANPDRWSFDQFMLTGCPRG